MDGLLHELLLGQSTLKSYHKMQMVPELSHPAVWLSQVPLSMCETRFTDLNQRCDKICTRQFETLLLPLDWGTAWRIGTNLGALTLLRMNGPMQSQ